MKKIFKILCPIVILIIVFFYFYFLYWILFKSGYFFIKFSSLPNLGLISFILFFALTFRGFVSLFEELKPIPEEIYKNWPNAIKIIGAILLFIIFCVISGLSGNYIRTQM